MLPDSPDVDAVLTADNGVFGSARPATLIIDFSSIRPDVTTTLSTRATDRGFRMIDAPVSGGQAGAIDARLSIMVGGTNQDFAAAKPVLDTVGATVVHVGPSGSGQTVKAANQLIVAGNLELLAEAIVFLEAYSVDTNAAIEVLGGGLAGSAVLQQKAQNMLTRSFDPGFHIELHHKDLGILTAATREAGVITPIGAVVTQLMASARAHGDGSLDHSDSCAESNGSAGTNKTIDHRWLRAKRSAAWTSPCPRQCLRRPRFAPSSTLGSASVESPPRARRTADRARRRPPAGPVRHSSDRLRHSWLQPPRR
jgi:2-hydroxy-3-oxopropionate reductase